MTVIAINGTPGSGKTTVADHLKRGGREIINIGQFAIEHGAVDGYDDENQCNIVDEDILETKLYQFLKGKSTTIIIEGHLADLVPPEFLDRCFVLEVAIPDLLARLEKRGYPPKKIEDNKLSELMKDCYMNSLDAFGSEKVELIPPLPIESVVKKIEDYLETKESVNNG